MLENPVLSEKDSINWTLLFKKIIIIILMESISTEKLPPIFKLPLLSKVLLYFGFLHDWKMILESINKGTKEIWTENKEILLYWGRNQKVCLDLDNDKIKYCTDILYKAELFKILTNNLGKWNLSKQDSQDLQKIEIHNLIFKIWNQLNKRNAIIKLFKSNWKDINLNKNGFLTLLWLVLARTIRGILT